MQFPKKMLRLIWLVKLVGKFQDNGRPFVSSALIIRDDFRIMQFPTYVHKDALPLRPDLHKDIRYGNGASPFYDAVNLRNHDWSVREDPVEREERGRTT